MATPDSTRIDPRERLVMVGNELLEVLYRMDGDKDAVKAMTDAKDDKEKLSELMAAPGSMEQILRAITDGFKRDDLLRQYVTLRQTIEALTEPRPDVLS